MQILTVDDVYDIIGHLGFSQFIYFVSLSLIQIFTCQHMLLNIYVGLEPPFHCYYEDEQSHKQNISGKCYKNAVSSCKLIFDDTHISIVNEWSLVCNEKYRVALVQSIFMGGVMVGALLLSGVADHIGRLRALMFSFMGTIIFEGFAAFSTSFVMLVTLRFFGGMCCAMVILVSFVLSQELIGTKRRSICAITLTMFFSVGIGLLSAMAANVRHWRSLTFLTAVFGIVYMIIPFFVPESPRWLVGKGRVKEAKQVLEKMAEANGTFHLLPTYWNLSSGSSKDTQKSNGAYDLISHSYVLKLTLIQIYSWFVNSAVYYALTMAAANVDGNVYWTTTVNGLVEIPACTSSIFIIERYGRRFGVCLFMLGGGLLCLTIPFAPTSLVTTLGLAGKVGISASFAVIYLHSGEIYPTLIRNTGMGVLSVAARFGGIVSPFLLMMGEIRPNLHFFFFGFLAISAGVLNLQLPETLGRPMPETVADILAFKNEIKNEYKRDSNSHYRKLQQLSEDEEEDSKVPLQRLEQPFTCYYNDKFSKLQNYTGKCFQNSASKCSLEFDESHFSIVNEWSLVCDKKYQVATVQSVFMAGVLIGALLLSGLADRVGRLKALMFSLMGTILFEGFAAFSTSYAMLVSVRFFAGMCCAIVILSSFVLSQELIGTKRRSICAVTFNMFFAIGIGFLSIMAAKVYHWRTLTFLTSSIGIVYLLIPFYVPESPRWLVGKGRGKEAKQVLEKMAKLNNTFHLLPIHWDLSGGGSKPSQKSHGAYDLMSHSYILKLTLIQIYSWFVNSAVYYALTMAAAGIQGNVYWTTTLNGLVEIPACTSGIFIIERYGRRFGICLFMLGGGLLCLAIPFAPTSLVTTLGLAGKLGISASFTIIYLHSGEIYPTLIRNTGMGVMSVAARVGGIIAPFLLMFGEIHQNLHFFFFGFLAISAAVLNLQLPETLGRPLPETLTDMLAFKYEAKFDYKNKTKSGYKSLTPSLEDGEKSEVQLN